LQIDQVFQIFNLFDLIVQQIQIHDLTKVSLPRKIYNSVLRYAVKLATQRYFWGHRIFNSRSACFFIFNELVMILHQFADVTLRHEIVKWLLKAAHIRAVQILGGQINRLHARVVFRAKGNHRSGFEYFLSFNHTLEQLGHLFIYDGGLLQSFVLRSAHRVSNVVEVN
jgi:hypothetical protein